MESNVESAQSSLHLLWLFSSKIIFCGKNTAISLENCGVFTAIFVYLQP